MMQIKTIEDLLNHVVTLAFRFEKTLDHLETVIEAIKTRDDETRAMAQQAFEAFCSTQNLAEETAKNLLTPAIVEETLRSSLEKLQMKWIEEARKRELEEAAEEFLLNTESPNRRWDA